MTKYPDKEARMKKFAATEGKDRYSSRRRASEGDYYNKIPSPPGHPTGWAAGRVFGSDDMSKGALVDAPKKPNNKTYDKGPYGQIKGRRK